MNTIQRLPRVILEHIYQYIPLVVTFQMNRYSYQNNRKSIRIPVINNDNYIRHLIRRDYNYVFSNLLNENYSKWDKINRYKHKMYIFDNYIQYLLHISIQYNSTRCRELINIAINSQNIKKRHKRIRTKTKKWTN